MAFEIIVKFEDTVIERVISEKKRLSIGRTNDCDIVLENRGVSRKHALIECNGNATVIIDNESLNGTFVNNRKITDEVLRDGDIITIGKYQIVYHAQVREGTVPETPTHMIPPKGTIIGIAEVNVQNMTLTKDVTTIGKHGADIQVEGWFLDTVHAKITRTASGFRIDELGRHEKTTVNGKKVCSVVLKSGDIVQVGRSQFHFVAQ